MYRLEKFYRAGFDRQTYWEDKYAQEHIAGTSSEEFRRQGFWPLLEQQLRNEGAYLDARCGIGGWILFLKEQGYDIKGIDIAARTVRALTEYDAELDVKVATITRIPYPDARFDGVLAIGTLEYVDGSVDEALVEVRRVLKSGGFFFAEVPIANGLRQAVYIPLKRLQRWIRTRRGEQPTFANYLFAPKELERLLGGAGFEVLAVRPHELPGADQHYGLYIDWPFLRGSRPYQLNLLGRLVKAVAETISPWLASTGMVVVARKK